MSILASQRKERNWRQYFLNSEVLKEDCKTKYVGVTFSEDCLWNDDVDETISKAGQPLSFMKCNLRTSKQNLKEIAYVMYIRPILVYARSAWNTIQRLLISWKRSRLVVCGMTWGSTTPHKTAL